MHRVGGNVDDRAGFDVDLLPADIGAESSLQHVDPLLVRMRMRLGAGTRLHAHQADNHTVTFHAWSMCSRIGGTAHNFLHGSEIEDIFTRSGTFGARCACSWPVGHDFLPRWFVLRDVSLQCAGAPVQAGSRMSA